MKASKLFLLFIIALSISTAAQKVKRNKLIGVWQVNTVLVGDAWNSNYRFYKDGTFRYSLNRYDDRGRIREIKGTYKLTVDTLALIVKSRVEAIGGGIVGGSSVFNRKNLFWKVPNL